MRQPNGPWDSKHDIFYTVKSGMNRVVGSVPFSARTSTDSGRLSAPKQLGCNSRKLMTQSPMPNEQLPVVILPLTSFKTTGMFRMRFLPDRGSSQPQPQHLSIISSCINLNDYPNANEQQQYSFLPLPMANIHTRAGELELPF